MKSPVVEYYYRAQNYIDIAWSEFSWFNESLLEMMAVVFFVEKITGHVMEGWLLGALLLSAFALCFILGIGFKKVGIYDKNVFVDYDIDPARKEILEAARIIINHHKLCKESQING